MPAETQRSPMKPPVDLPGLRPVSRRFSRIPLPLRWLAGVVSVGLAAFTPACGADSGNGTIAGRVANAATGRQLEGAVVEAARPWAAGPHRRGGRVFVFGDPTWPPRARGLLHW